VQFAVIHFLRNPLFMSRAVNQDLFREAAMVPPGTFEQCCRQWYPSLYRTVLLLVRDRHLAEDVLQEALVQGYQALADLRDPDRLEPWLRRIAVREALAALRARKVRSRQSGGRGMMSRRTTGSCPGTRSSG
jgi:DNA-directed RNA polymerase specialized sigma24 family protein